MEPSVSQQALTPDSPLRSLDSYVRERGMHWHPFTKKRKRESLRSFAPRSFRNDDEVESYECISVASRDVSAEELVLLFHSKDKRLHYVARLTLQPTGERDGSEQVVARENLYCFA